MIQMIAQNYFITSALASKERGNAFIQANRAQMRRKEKKYTIPSVSHKGLLFTEYLVLVNTFQKEEVQFSDNQ